MKIVFIIDNARHIGGGDYAQFVFANTLAQKGHEVTIFAGNKHFYSPELEKPRVFYRHTIPIVVKRVGLGKLNQLWSALYTKTVVIPQIKKIQPDIIVGYLRDSAIKAQQIGAKLGIPVANFVFENPKWMEEDLKEAWQEEWSHAGFRTSWNNTKTAYEQSTILIPNSKLSGKKMREWLPKATISKPVYPGVEVPKQRQLKRSIDIIYIGRLNKLKNVSDLLHAAKPEWNIVIVGKGEQEAKLKSLANELGLQVDFKGSISDTKKWALLRSSKIMVFASSHEGFGMPPLEALACGCNVVCSDIPIFHEIYGNEVTYFPLHDQKELQKKIESTLEKNPYQGNIAQKYTWEKAAKDIEKILGGVLK